MTVLLDIVEFLLHLNFLLDLSIVAFCLLQLLQRVIFQIVNTCFLPALVIKKSYLPT